LRIRPQREGERHAIRRLAAQFTHLDKASFEFFFTGIRENHSADLLHIIDLCAGGLDAHRDLGRWRRFARAGQPSTRLIGIDVEVPKDSTLPRTWAFADFACEELIIV
jgi:hypothetical protein